MAPVSPRSTHERGAQQCETNPESSSITELVDAAKFTKRHGDGGEPGGALTERQQRWEPPRLRHGHRAEAHNAGRGLGEAESSPLGGGEGGAVKRSGRSALGRTRGGNPTHGRALGFTASPLE
ncbi:unnamed protein product [Lampetra fluviatilis]